MISKSPDRFTFQKDAYLARCKDEGETPSPEYLALYDGEAQEATAREQDPEWQQNNLEYDLRTCDWMLSKVRNSEKYAQNLYAAMCNTQFIKNEMFPLLKNQRWSCSWRYAGGIVADMRGEGDYIDWYCSGIKGMDDDQFQQLDAESKERYLYMQNNFVSESVVTDEVRDDFLRLGWQVVEWEDDDPT